MWVLILVRNRIESPLRSRLHSQLSITSNPYASANGVARRRSVAKEEVWLSLRVAAIQRRWLKRLDCERLFRHFLWNLNYFGTARFVILTHKWRPKGDIFWVAEVVTGRLKKNACILISLLALSRAKAALARVCVCVFFRDAAHVAMLALIYMAF